MSTTELATFQILIRRLGALIEGARSRAIQAVNQEMVSLYWELGRHIIEYEQGGADRAAYGKKLLATLSTDLVERFGRGFSEQNLRNFRQLYVTYPIRQSVPSELSWTHLLHLMRVDTALARQFYEL